LKTRRPKAEGRRPNSLLPSSNCGASFGFGFRISAFFRPSDFGFRVLHLLIVFSTSALTLAANTNNLPDPASSLQPPRGEILPTFWEQYGTWIMLAGVLLTGAIALVVWLGTRPKPAVPVPWSVQARRQLEPLRGQPEDGRLLSEVSQIVRHYIAAAFGLSSDEATTSEFCRTLAACEKIGTELSADLSSFFKECDLRKFAPTPPASAYGVVGRSLKIIEVAENRLAQPNSIVVPTGNSDSPRSPKERREQIASGA
jgi:hypothetical protein